jgi:hypothetical protein
MDGEPAAENEHGMVPVGAQRLERSQAARPPSKLGALKQPGLAGKELDTVI